MEKKFDISTWSEVLTHSDLDHVRISRLKMSRNIWTGTYLACLLPEEAENLSAEISDPFENRYNLPGNDSDDEVDSLQELENPAESRTCLGLSNLVG